MAVVSSCRETAGDKPEEGEDHVKSSCPLCPGRLTCYNGRDKGRDHARDPARAPIGIGGPTRRAISSAVERAPDNCHGVLFLFESEFETKLLLRRIDGAIQVRSNVDLTFYSLVGPGRSGGDHHGSSLLENPYTPYQSPNNASSQTKNYEIAPFILG
ncbi:hypothetical protein LUZ63_024117 [Rhynchospora breviuscula]|uniref:Uncharacterized protein ycf68 n=1 Tax=Rhynchospora breviuscula TaxID=2022672 RepID=A0A9P9Z1N8_9POAL|nr:hypothetical protein LUZ63_024117 [Rhynchospora breviuscula]